ncbi:MAG: ABC transporter substrate-binding protein [Alphaproteobacteria bacterium]|nr:ABC transporter substrate-binding protein [Alphaproteobacteria bacterium]
MRRPVTSIAMAGMLVLGLSAVQANAFDGELWIGAYEPMSGPGAALGIGASRGVGLAIDEWNARGGIKLDGKAYEIKYKVYDHKYSAELAVEVANKLVFDDGIKILVTNSGSGPTIAATEAVLEKNKIFNTTTGWNPKAIGADKTYTYRVWGTGNEFGASFLRWWIKNFPDKNKIAVFEGATSAGMASGALMKQHALALGFDVVHEDYTDETASDFYAPITAMMAAGPDLIEMSATRPGHEGLIVKQLHELGYEGTIVSAGTNPDETLKIAGAEAMEGMYLLQSISYESPDVSAAQKAYAKKYQEKYNEKFVTFHSEKMYDAANGVFSAIEACQCIDPTELRDFFATFSWETLSGQMTAWGGEKTYGIKRQMIHALPINVFKDGQIITIAFGMPDVP